MWKKFVAKSWNAIASMIYDIYFMSNDDISYCDDENIYHTCNYAIIIVVYIYTHFINQIASLLVL